MPDNISRQTFYIKINVHENLDDNLSEYYSYQHKGPYVNKWYH